MSFAFTPLLTVAIHHNPSHNPHTQSLDLCIDLNSREVHGNATIWVFLPPTAAEEADSIGYKLHARQMVIHEVKVNSKPVPFEYPYPLDLFKVIIIYIHLVIIIIIIMLNFFLSGLEEKEEETRRFNGDGVCFFTSPSRSLHRI